MSQRARLSSLWCLKRFAWLSLVVLVLTVRTGLAQRSLAYGFVAANSSPRQLEAAVLHYGIGGAAGVSRRVALGAEVGGLHMDPKGVLGSVNVTVHLGSASRSEHLDPFVTGGLSAVYWRRSGGLYANVGTGVHYWFRPRIGARAEVRAYLPAIHDLSSFAEFRLGIAFR